MNHDKLFDEDTEPNKFLCEHEHNHFNRLFKNEIFDQTDTSTRWNFIYTWSLFTASEESIKRHSHGWWTHHLHYHLVRGSRDLTTKTGVNKLNEVETVQPSWHTAHRLKFTLRVSHSGDECHSSLCGTMFTALSQNTDSGERSCWHKTILSALSWSGALHSLKCGCQSCQKMLLGHTVFIFTVH